MTGKPSAIGFGFQSFGNHPFGSADWAEEVTFRIIPMFYRDDDALCEFDPPQPLRGVINAIKPPLQELKDTWEDFPNLWDANKVRIDQLPYLAANFTIVQNPAKDEALRRAEVLNAIFLFRNKGTDLGYEITAGLEGLLVTITPLWAENKLPGAALVVPDETGFAPGTTFFAQFDDFPADEIPTDNVFTDLYDKWPRSLNIRDYCRSSWLDLFFEAPGDVEIENFDIVANEVIRDLDRVTPIHVRFRSITFDGPKAVAGGWRIGPVTAVNSAVGGGWSISVTGEQRATGGGWSVPVTGIPTP
jgi:hypothetical protein